MNTRDVEKRWHDPRAYRHAVAYCVSVVAVAMIAAGIFLGTGRSNVLLAALVPAVCLAGGIGALIVGYRAYRVGGTWPIWQGAAWFLFVLMLFCLSLPMIAGQDVQAITR